ncbi:MAG: hypothetical protein U0J42_06020 [[Bacteroides] pectinophilus]|jgi:hypothetical protein|uniref:Uncharacterized protein n=1 Tax=Bacteroides pectinophilus CAG:437 TaxID=1263051 RepID=R7AJN8_9FIRM|nr:hypothetical protein [[Bacteroides] pectinophilus]CDD58580.1 putative uncharacterized protein [Bacteroides pectinophilus CAG:437]
MKEYIRPAVTVTEETGEGVYAASGSTQGGNQNGPVSCESKYMNGQYQNMNYTSSDGSVKDTFGCLGCNCYRQGYCGLEELQWGSYDNDNGFRKPGWEQEGKSPTDRAW